MNLIFDIGYNHGRFTDACFNKYPSTQVVALEANPNLCDKPNEDNFVLLNRVVSNIDNEYIDFYIEHGADGISTASENWINNSRFTKNYVWYEPLKLKSTSLDSLILKYGEPDLIKIDVEGYELEVLKGLTKKSKEICQIKQYKAVFHQCLVEEFFLPQKEENNLKLCLMKN